MILKNCRDLQKNLAAKEKESVRMKKASDRNLSEKGSNHTAQVKALTDLHSKENREKDAIICDKTKNASLT